jgi:hypothetical protein
VEPPLTFYFDRNFGRGLPESLSCLRLKVVHHHTPKALLNMPCRNRKDPLFLPNASDDEWLSFVGQKGWVAFSHDKKFHKPGYELELAALKQFNVACFYLWGAKARPHEKARCFLRAYDKIVHAVQTTQRPFIYNVDEAGKLLRVPIS